MSIIVGSTLRVPCTALTSTGKNAAKRDDRDLHRRAETEEEHERREQRGLRDRTHEFGERFEEVVDAAERSHQDSERDRAAAADRVAGKQQRERLQQRLTTAPDATIAGERGRAPQSAAGRSRG